MSERLSCRVGDPLPLGWDPVDLGSAIFMRHPNTGQIVNSLRHHHLDGVDEFRVSLLLRGCERPPVW
jgi:hypothetical protein